MSEIDLDFKLHPNQYEIFSSPARFRAVAAGRRFGKSYLAAAECIISALQDTNKYGYKLAGKPVWYIAPTWKQGMDAVWHYITDLGKAVIASTREKDGVIRLVNGAQIHIKGSDRPDCYDEQTEILTSEGWKRFQDLNRTEKVLTLNPDGLQAEWQRPYKYVDQAYSGKVYRLKARGSLDLVVTPGHNFLVRSSKGKLKLKTVEELSLSGDSIPAKTGWVGRDNPAISEDMCALMGFYLAEGTAYGNCGGDITKRNGNYEVFFAQTPGAKGGIKGDVKAQFRLILERLGYTVRDRGDGFSIYNKALWQSLLPLGNKYHKRLPQEYKDLPVNKLQLILDWFIKGDGSIRLKEGRTKPDIVMYSVSKGLLDDLQEIAIKCGWSANLTLKHPAGPCTIMGRESYNVNCYQLQLRHSQYKRFSSSRKSYISEEAYTGRIGCVGVRNHVVMVRRNGIATWSGNTLRGSGLRGAVLDEFASMKPATWDQIISPALADVKGWGLFIGTPHFTAPHFRELWERARESSAQDDWAAFTYTSTDNPYVDAAAEIERMRAAGVPEAVIRQEMYASFNAMGDKVLDPSKIVLVNSAPFTGSWYVLVDPAGFSDEGKGLVPKSRDECAIAVVCVGEQGWYIEDIVHGRWGVRETALKIVATAAKYRPRLVGVEKGSLKNALMPYMDDRMRQLGVYPQIAPLTHGGQKKTERIIWALQGRLESGRIYAKKAPFNQHLFSQMLDFPNKFAHDDLIDALAYTDQIADTPFVGAVDMQPSFEVLDVEAGY